MVNNKLWFRAKRYGFGWYPVSVEGWVVMLVYFVIIVSLAKSVDAYSHSTSDTLINFALPFIGLTSFLLAICYAKGEYPRWRWGSEIPQASKILKAIKKSKRILLHCHPSPDPDSVGSALAMKYALEQLGKKVTIIQGDSEIPQAFMHFPGVGGIEKKSFSEVDLTKFDLFIIQDSGSPEMISRKNKPTFPLPIRTIVIDHHDSNKAYADINLIDAPAPSVTYILYKLFQEWNIKITPEIAANLFIGLYTDTGGFKYSVTGGNALTMAAELAHVFPAYPKLVFEMENSHEKEEIYVQAIALHSIQTFHNDHLAVSAVSKKSLDEKGVSAEALSQGYIASILKSVIGWDVAVCMVEVEAGTIKMSFRTRDAEKYDVSKLAVALGGGGHKGAAGAVLTMPLSEAVEKVVETTKKLYNL
jgi:phosphoesterase RecJ-like protein